MSNNKNGNFLMKMKEENYDLQGYINEVRRNYSSYGYPKTCIPCLFNKVSEGKFAMNTDFYSKIGYNRVLTMSHIMDFLKNSKDGVIHICFALGDCEGNISMANGEVNNISNIKVGNINLKERESFGINIELKDGHFIFEQVKYSIDEETFSPILDLIDDSGELRGMVVGLIEKFKH